MNAPHLHLILNHVPTIGSAIAIGLLLLGLLRRQEALTRVSLEVFFVVALVTLPAYLSGVATGMLLETMPDVSVEAIQKHHDGPLAAGSHALAWDAAAAPPGLYLVRVTAGDVTHVHRVTRVR